MTRILIDCSYIDFQRQPTGIPRVVLKYVEEGYAWADATGNEVIPIVPTADGLYLCRPVPGAHAPQALLDLQHASTAYEARASERPALANAGPGDAAPHLIKPMQGDIVFSPAYWHDNDPTFYRNAKQAGAKIVILIHDILPIAFKKYYRTPWRYHFAAAVLQALDYADQILCVSDTTKQAVEAFAAQRGSRLPSIGVAHNGFQDLVPAVTVKRMLRGDVVPHATDAAARKALTSAGPLLMVGSIEPKKGHMPVIRTLEAMWAAGYSRNLVIVGRVGWMEREIVDYIEQSPYFGSRLFWLNGIDDHDLALAYVGSHALVFASIAEGFGIPLIEASRFGRPVVVLDTDIAREVLGEVGNYFDEASDLVRTLVALEDPAVYAEACARAAAFEWPTWEDCVPKVFDDLLLIETAPDVAAKPFTRPLENEHG